MHNIDQIVMLLRNAWNKINNWIELEMIAESWKPQLLMLCSVYFCFIQSGPSSAWESRLAVFISFAFAIYSLSLAVHILSVLVHSKHKVLLAGKKRISWGACISLLVWSIDRTCQRASGALVLIDFHDSHSLLPILLSCRTFRAFSDPSTKRVNKTTRLTWHFVTHQLLPPSTSTLSRWACLDIKWKLCLWECV